jgi:DNA-binding NarL/FixJ family response regulator
MSASTEVESNRAIRVLSIDDNPVFRAAVRRFFYRHDGFILLDSVQDSESALLADHHPPPHVILLDLHLADKVSLDLMHVLREKWRTAKIIILTFDDRAGYREASLRAGADDFVSKLRMANDLIPAILKAVQADSSGGKRGDPACQ